VEDRVGRAEQNVREPLQIVAAPTQNAESVALYAYRRAALYSQLRGRAGPNQRTGGRDSQDVSIRTDHSLTHQARLRIPPGRLPSPSGP